MVMVAEEANSRERQNPTSHRKVFVQRDTNGSLGFMFSTNKRPTSSGVSHFISVVDAGSPAEEAGLKVGDRILIVNDISVLTMTHAQVVQLLQSTPPKLPIKLVVTEPNQIILSSIQRHSSSCSVIDAPPGPSAAPMGQVSRTASRGGSTASISIEDERHVAIFVKNSSTEKILAVSGQEVCVCVCVLSE
jgi:predicted metalloprotease with PDZ domain